MAINRRDVLDIMKDGGLVPVFNHEDEELAKKVIKACYDGGVRVFEWTNRSAGALALFPGLVSFVKESCLGMRLGAGSVMSAETAEKFFIAGAEFLVSPVFDPDIARFAVEEGIPYIPGCGSVTEIHQSQKYGSALVKVFPGNVLGPEFVRAVLGPMPWTEIMPTGGVTSDRDNLEAWFRSGVKCVGMGANLIKREWLNDQGMGEIEKLVSLVLNHIRQIRGA